MTPGKRGMTGKHGNHWRPPLVERVALTCEVCGAVKHLLPSVARRRSGRFCSQACKGKSADRRVSTPCAHCGIVTLKRRAHLAANRSAFCSPQCLAASKRRDDARWRDPEQIRAYMRAYVQANRTRHNTRSRQWAATHRDKRNELQRARRASQGPQGLTAKDWTEIRRRYGFRCLACGASESLLVRLEPDHVVAIARGGSHSKDNIQPLCRRCNAAKGAKHIDYRAQYGIDVQVIK